jgi:hypothetical protein
LTCITQGNRLYSSLGNIEASSLAAVSFVSFETGDIIYVTGEATNLIGPAAQSIMPSQNTLTTLRITGYIFVASSLALIQNPEVPAERSPYSPPIKLLAEERHDLVSSSSGGDTGDIYATLQRVTVHSPTLATLEFTLSKPIRAVKAGQAAILDFSELVGRAEYAHMNDDDPQGLNDERVRTWTISDVDVWSNDDDGGDDDDDESSRGRKTSKFALTMREKKGGFITGMLFRNFQKLQVPSSDCNNSEGVLNLDPSSLGITVKLVGVGGDFVIASPPAGDRKDIGEHEHERYTVGGDEDRFLWIAGGIGVTPFLAMLSSLVRSSSTPSTIENRLVGKNYPKTEKIHLVLSTREPNVLLSLISRALAPNQHQNQNQNHATNSSTQTTISLLLDIFTPADAIYNDIVLAASNNQHTVTINARIRRHMGRVPADFFMSQAVEREHIDRARVYLCGPHPFENDMMSALENAGCTSSRVVRENFDY